MCVCVWAEDAYEREYRERRERREREQREREQREKLVATASDKTIELTDKEKELEQMKVGGRYHRALCVWDVTSLCLIHLERPLYN